MPNDPVLQAALQSLFALDNPHLEHLNTLVNDVAVVTTPSAKFALKLYNIKSRTVKDVQWELDLIEHLVEHGAPVAKPILGKHGYVETLILDGRERAAALFEWAPGEKPKPSHEVYMLLGKAAAKIHQAADSFKPTWMRETHDTHELIDEQIERMKKHLVEVKQYDTMLALGERLKALIADPKLDQGICHMDLTLDNIHVHDDNMTVFDFDSAAYCWRAYEPYGVLRFSKDYFKDWLIGYRSTRQFSEVDEKAVYAFAIIGDIHNTVWKLGEANSSRGDPLMTAKELPKVVEEYLEWERENLAK